MEKECKICGKNFNARDLRQLCCGKECSKKNRKEHDKKYHEAHKEYYIEYMKIYREAHREHRKENDKIYREAHREHYREYDKKWRDKKWIEDPQYMIDHYAILSTYSLHEPYMSAILPTELEHAKEICRKARLSVVVTKKKFKKNVFINISY